MTIPLRDRNDVRTLPGAKILTEILALGAFDHLTVALTCEGCGKESEQTLGWYQSNQLQCQCGGAFNAEPLRVALRTLNP